MSEAGPPRAPAQTQTTNPDLAGPGRRDLVGKVMPGAFASLVGTLKRLKGPIVAFAAVGAVLSGVLGYLNVYRAIHDTAAPSIANPSSSEPPFMSIAVLPFNGVGGKTIDESLAESLTHSVTSALARSARYALVASYGNISSYKGK